MAIDAGSIYSSVRVRLDKLSGDVKSVERLLDQIGTSSQTNAKRTEDAFTDSFNATKLAGVAAFAAITVAMKQSIKVAGDYEQSIANVQSVVMGTDEVFQQLSEAAKEAGETTRFTASQSADALYDLASGGMSAEESIASLNGVLMLAGATQSSLSEAARITVATLNQYNLKAEESTRISNVFAASIANSMANMEKLTAGMRQVGPVASAMGLSLEETVGALSALYDAGFQGEQAGTALRAILASIASEADPTTRKLMEMGLTFDQINPAANSFADVIQNISDAGLTAGDVMNAFGTRAGAQMLALLNEGKEGLEEYERAVTGTSTASEMYAIQNDTLAGSLDRLKSAAQSAQIEFVEEVTPALRDFLEILTDIIIRVADMPGPIKVFFATLLAGIPVVLAVTKGLVALKAAMLGVSGPIGWAVAAVAAATAGFSALKDKLDEIETEKTNRDFGELAEQLGMTAEKLKELTEEADSFGLELSEFDALVASLNLSTDALEILQMMLNQTMMSGDSVTQYVGRWAEVLGISAEALMRVLVASDLVNEADKAYLNTLLGTIDMEKKRNEEREQAAKTEDEIMLEQKRANAARNAERLAGLKKEGQAQQALFDVYDATLSEIDRKLELGVVTEKEANEERKKASDKLIESLLEQETAYISNDEAIRQAVASGKSYEQAVKDQEEAEKAAKKAEEERAQALAEVEEQTEQNRLALEEMGKTEAEIAELERDRQIATIEGMDIDEKVKENAIAAINARYDGYVKLMEAEKREAADNALQAKMEQQKKQMEELGKTELELLEVKRERAKEEARMSGASSELIEKSIKDIDAYYDALVNEEKDKQRKKIEEENSKILEDNQKEQERLTKAQEEDAEEYMRKLEELGKEELELIEIRRKRAVAEAKASGATDEAIAKNVKSINEYYDALVNEEEAKQEAKLEEERQKNLEKTEEDAEKAAKKQADLAESYIQKAEEVGKKELELIEIRRAREIAAARAAGGEQEAIDASIAAINAYYDALTDEEVAAQTKKLQDEETKRQEKITEETEKAAEKQLATDQKQIDSATSYQQKLEDMGKTELELIEIQRRRAIAAALASGASARVINENIDAINEYYDALEETTAEDAAIAKTKKMAQDIKDIWDDLSGSLASLFSAIYDDKLDALEDQLKAELEAAGLQEKTASELAEAELADARATSEKEIALIQKRLDAAKEAGDEQAAILIQQQIDEANARATEIEEDKQAAVDKANIEEEYEERRKQIQYEAAMVQWKLQMAQAVADAAMLALNGFLTKPFIPAGLIAGGVATAQGALQISAVTMAKPKLATGGIVLPQMGGRDVTLAENGYPEMALNSGPSGQELMGMFAQQIVDKMNGNRSEGRQPIVVQVVVNRKVLSETVVDDINNGRVRLNK